MKNKLGAILLILLSCLGTFLSIEYLENNVSEPEQKYLLDKELQKRDTQKEQEIPQKQIVIQAEKDIQAEKTKKVVEVDKHLEKAESEYVNPEISEQVIQEIQLVEKPELVPEQLVYNFPENHNLPVPFHSQSPLGMWGEVFGETCEEASLLIAHSYFMGPYYTKKEFREELLKIVSYENKTFGDYKHTNVEQTAQILRDFYNYSNFQILRDPTVEEMKFHLSAGSLILAPFYGVGLNPYYSENGPEYHFMVIKGYTKDTFITHDVGTKRGANYEYPITELMERLHDYHPESIKLGDRKIIVVSSSS